MLLRRLRLAALMSMRRPLLAVVAFALIGAQSFGLSHRIEHGTAEGWIDAAEVDDHHHHDHDHAHDHAHSTHSDGTTDHSCAGIDALALGDGPPAAVQVLRVRTQAPTRAAARLQPDPASPPQRPFQARAPPALLS